MHHESAMPSRPFALLVLSAALTAVIWPAGRAFADEVWDQEPKGVNPATGAPAGAPAGCCCFPKQDPTATAALTCKPGMVEFDCTVECAQLRDGREPSKCTWTKGDCPK
jgi:hypothetical protein